MDTIRERSEADLYEDAIDHNDHAARAELMRRDRVQFGQEIGMRVVSGPLVSR
jgi:hypothetical protein